MAVTALIVFDQGGPGTAGEAFEGTVAGGVVTVTNDDNTNVASWVISLVDVPPDSALTTGVLATADSATPSATFTPDVPGSYRIDMLVYDAAGLTGSYSEDIRNFGIRNVRGIILPPYQKNPDPLPLIGSGDPRAKPDEQNYGGQLRGWAGNRASGQLEQFFQTYDDLAVTTVTSGTFTAAASGEPPVYFVDLATIGASSLFTLPSGARVGQRFRIIVGPGLLPTDRIHVNAPIGHSFFPGGPPILYVSAFESIDCIYIGSSTWVTQGGNLRFTKRTLVAGTQTTTLTGFVTIGAFYFNPDEVNFLGPPVVDFEAQAEAATGTETAVLRLYNVTTSAVVSGSTLSTSATIDTHLIASSVVLDYSASVYEVQLQSTLGNAVTCHEAHLSFAEIKV